tara:strand:+ start:12429 stop:13802 length:1374 start_codon:yes stop_codon:yes gene_type:complete
MDDSNKFSAVFGTNGGSGGGGGGGLTSVDIQNTLYVAKNGNDSTGVRNDLSKPFLTISGASASSLSGDAIYVFSGTYQEVGTESFVSLRMYYLELGVVVSNELSPVIDDSSQPKVLKIYGQGEIRGGGGDTGDGVGGVALFEEETQLYLQCKTITTNKYQWSINVENILCEIDVFEILLQTGGNGIKVIEDTRGYINFNTFYSGRDGGDNINISLENVGGVNETPAFFLRGQKATIDFTATALGGSGIVLDSKASVGLKNTIVVEIDEIQVLAPETSTYLTINDAGTTGIVRFNNTRIFVTPSIRTNRIIVADGDVYFRNVTIQNGGGIELTGTTRSSNFVMFNCNMVSDTPCITTNNTGVKVNLMNSTFYNTRLSGAPTTGVIFLNAAQFGFFHVNNVILYAQDPASNNSIASLSAATISIQGFFGSNSAMTTNILNNIAGTTNTVDSDILLPNII